MTLTVAMAIQLHNMRSAQADHFIHYLATKLYTYNYLLIPKSQFLIPKS